ISKTRGAGGCLMAVAGKETRNVVQTPGGYLPSDALSSPGTQVGENWVPEGSNDPASALGAPELRGDVEAEATSSGDLDSGEEPPMKVDTILAKWEGAGIGQDYRD